MMRHLLLLFAFAANHVLAGDGTCSLVSQVCVDGPSTKVIGGNMVKVISWYDNETGFSHRVVDLMKILL